MGDLNFLDSLDSMLDLSLDSLGTEKTYEDLIIPDGIELTLNPLLDTDFRDPSPLPIIDDIADIDTLDIQTTTVNTQEQSEDDLTNIGSEDDVEPNENDDNDLIEKFIPRCERIYTWQVEEDPAYTSKCKSIERLKGGEKTMLPCTLYHFQFKPFPKTGKPHLRREDFDEESGPRSDFATPYDAFTAIWTEEIMEYIAEQTNIYANQTYSNLRDLGKLTKRPRLSVWKDTDKDELYRFFAIILATGMCIKSNMRDYWCHNGNITETPKFTEYMSFVRYSLLMRFLHFNDNTKMPYNFSPTQAKLFKISPIIDYINKRFETLFQMGQDVIVDTSLSYWKDSIETTAKDTDKVIVGLKCYEVADSKTGYVWRVEVTGGRLEPETRSDAVAIPLVILRLLNGLQNKGHTLWLDNCFNCPALARFLKTLGFDCVGTLRINRQFVPPPFATMNTKKFKPGEVIGCTSRDVDIVLWKDRELVPLISTYHGIAISPKVDKRKPVLVEEYNACLRVVDKRDAILTKYPIERKKSHGWYKKFFRKLLNKCVYNAYILHTNSKCPKDTMITTHKEFRFNLIRALLEKHKCEIRKIEPAKLCLAINRPVFTQDALDHFPTEYGYVPTRKGEKIRKSCTICKRRTQTFCPGCKVSLCAFTCHKDYHSDKPLVIAETSRKKKAQEN